LFLNYHLGLILAAKMASFIRLDEHFGNGTATTILDGGKRLDLIVSKLAEHPHH
jgi:hypothetical protein